MAFVPSPPPSITWSGSAPQCRRAPAARRDARSKELKVRMRKLQDNAIVASLGVLAILLPVWEDGLVAPLRAQASSSAQKFDVAASIRPCGGPPGITFRPQLSP